MADNHEDRFTADDGGEGNSSLDIAAGEDPKASTKPDLAEGIEFDNDGTAKATVAEGAGTDPEDGGEDPEANAEEGAEEKAKGDEPSAAEALPEWDPENEEVTAKYDGRFFTEDGQTLNTSAFSEEVAANLAKEDGKAELNAGTYGWLKDRMGVSKEVADQFIAGQLALRQQNEDAFYSKVGGKEAYEAKKEWAGKNYTHAQVARHNKAMDAGGEEAEEALELLNARFAAAGGKVEGATEKPKGLPKGVQKRPASPARTTSTAQNPGGSGGVEPFKSADEHRAAMKAAGDDKEQQALVRKRLAASSFWK